MPGHRVLLCSDGLWDMLADEEIARLAAIPDIVTAATTLIETANNAGGDDNITVVVVSIG